jgi:hypothetical protein
MNGSALMGGLLLLGLHNFFTLNKLDAHHITPLQNPPSIHHFAFLPSLFPAASLGGWWCCYVLSWKKKKK